MTSTADAAGLSVVDSVSRLVPDRIAAGAQRIGRSRLKRIMDVTLSGLALLTLWPAFLLIALAIRVDSPGPAIFRQVRYGRGGRFTILKFRTMTADASSEPFRQATVGDDRFTRVGRISRRTNLDELPQLINVFRGDMSLAGPRPHPIELDDAFAPQVPGLMSRYAVLPGITGWAQVNGLRGETPDAERMSERIRFDLEYIDRWSLRLDVVILWRTLFHLRSFENAY